MIPRGALEPGALYDGAKIYNFNDAHPLSRVAYHRYQPVWVGVQVRELGRSEWRSTTEDSESSIVISYPGGFNQPLRGIGTLSDPFDRSLRSPRSTGAPTEGSEPYRSHARL